MFNPFGTRVKTDSLSSTSTYLSDCIENTNTIMEGDKILGTESNESDKGALTVTVGEPNTKKGV